MNRIKNYLILSLVYFQSCTNETELGPPEITYTPDIISIGTSINIYGKNFGDNISEIEVKFNGIVAECSTYEKDIVKCIVPNNITAGKITLARNSLVSESPNEYLVTNWKLLTKSPEDAIGNPNDIFFYDNDRLYTRSRNSIIQYDIIKNNFTKLSDFKPPNIDSTLSDLIPPPYFPLDGKLYVLYKVPSQGSFIGGFYEVNLETNNWSLLSSFPREISLGNIKGFSTKDKGYFLTNINVSSSLSKKELWEFDPLSNSWRQLADFPGEYREGFAMYYDELNIYLGAGNQNGKLFKDRWQYNISSNIWTRIEDFPGNPRFNPLLFHIQNRIYYGFGIGFPPTGGGLNSFEDFYVYDQTNNSWNQTEEYYGYHPTTQKSYTSSSTKGYIVFELDNNNLWEYDPK